MQEALNKIVNLGIGTVKTVNAESEELYGKLQAQVNEWIAEGESATDENSVRVKSVLEQGLANYKKVEGKVEELIQNLSEQIEQLKADQPAETAAAKETVTA